MKKTILTRVQCVLLFIFLFILCMERTGFDSSSTALAYATKHHFYPHNGQNHITILILEGSFSMNIDDPYGLRCSVTNAYIEQSQPDDQIGLLGLVNNNNSRENGPYTFLKAELWQQPTSMSSSANRHQMQLTVDTNLHNCQQYPTASESIPTYDALAQALTMLSATTDNGHPSGSVLLLADNVPSPDTDSQGHSQITAIEKDLLPKFKQNHWPINTIALGSAVTSRSFLGSLAEESGGHPYDDYNRTVSGDSPLNIEPFFHDNYENYIGRIIQAQKPQAMLSKDVTNIPYTFTVNEETDYLDIIVVKDSPGITATLTTPSPPGITLPPAEDKITIFSDNAYETVFSIPNPTAGDWTLTITGTGTFLVDYQYTSLSKITISPLNDSVLPLGEQFTISADVTRQNTRVADLTVKAEISFTGSLPPGSPVPEPIELFLSDSANAGIYEKNITVSDTTYPPGSYQVMVSIYDGISNVTPTAFSSSNIHLERLPSPFFIAQQTHMPTTKPGSYSFSSWDPNFLWLIDQMSFTHLPLAQLFSPPAITIPLQVQLNGKPYLSATLLKLVTLNNASKPISVKVLPSGQGTFSLLFPSDIPDGTYQVQLLTGGAKADSQGYTKQTTTSIRITHIISWQSRFEVWALVVIFLLFSLLFLIILLFVICSLMRSLVVPRPFGTCSETEDGSKVICTYYFKDAEYKISSWWLLGRHVLTTNGNKVSNGEKSMPPGLQFRFDIAGAIKIRPNNDFGEKWHLQPGFQEVSKLIYTTDKMATKTYFVEARTKNTSKTSSQQTVATEQTNVPVQNTSSANDQQIVATDQIIGTENNSSFH